LGITCYLWAGRKQRGLTIRLGELSKKSNPLIRTPNTLEKQTTNDPEKENSFKSPLTEGKKDVKDLTCNLFGSLKSDHAGKAKGGKRKGSES